MDENAEPLGRGEPPPRCSARGSVPVRIAPLRSTRLPGGGRSPVSFGMRRLEMPRQPRMLRTMTNGFAPIRLEDYVERHLRSNPDTKREDLIHRLHYAIAAFRRGEHCRCGQAIWIIGSAEVGLACFTCITGESEPDRDYEIDLSGFGDTPAEPPGPANGSQPSRPDAN